MLGTQHHIGVAQATVREKLAHFSRGDAYLEYVRRLIVVLVGYDFRLVTTPLQSTQKAVCVQVIHIKFRKVKFRKIWAKRLVLTNQSCTLQRRHGIINGRNSLNISSMPWELSLVNSMIAPKLSRALVTRGNSFHSFFH